MSLKKIGHSIKLPAGWEMYALFLSWPLWWVLGAVGFIWPFLVLPLLFLLLLRGRIAIPPGFGLWFLFLVWMLASASQVGGEWRWLAFVYRASLYLSSTVLFLYIYNAPFATLPNRAIVGALASFWAVVAFGGFMAILFPHVSFRSLVEMILPQELLGIGFIYDLVHPTFAAMSLIPGFSVVRPRIFLTYTNAWGGNFALLTPFILAVLAETRSKHGRTILSIILILSLVPFLVSLNRGAWLSIGLALIYVAMRFALQSNFRSLAALVIFFALTGFLLLLTPVGDVVAARVEIRSRNMNSVENRLVRDEEVIDRVLDSPLLGFGTPQRSEGNPDSASLGTHGQAFGILFSHGIPGFVFFVGWFIYTLVRTARSVDAIFWAHVVIFIGLIQSLYYTLVPMQLHIMMVAAALAWRHLTSPFEEVPGRTVVAGTSST